MERNILEACGICSFCFRFKMTGGFFRQALTRHRGYYFCNSWFVPKCKSLCGKDEKFE